MMNSNLLKNANGEKKYSPVPMNEPLSEQNGANMNWNQAPKGHKDMVEKIGGDTSKCPAFQFMNLGKADGMGSKSGKEQEMKELMKQGQGACPFLPKGDEERNPALEPLNEGFSLEYVSPFAFLFHNNPGTAFLGNKHGQVNTADQANRTVLDSYPIYLKHTLFHTDEVVEKTRRHEIASRFFVVDDLCSYGNKKYRKGKYEKAISYFEKALACLKWLEYIPPSRMGENHPANITPEFALMMADFDDDNVVLINEDENIEPWEKETKDSMLLQIYLNLACCYTRLFYFKEAMRALEDGFAISKTSSQLHYRRSQVIAYNRESTYDELKKAKEDIEKAIELKKKEKVFQGEKRILIIANLLNADEAYAFQKEFVDKRIEQRTVVEKEILKTILLKVKDTLFVEGTLRSEEKKQGVPEPAKEKEEPAKKTPKDFYEYSLVQDIMRRYYKIIEFHREGNKKDQVEMARKELLDVRAIVSKMEYVMRLDFARFQNNDLLLELIKDLRIKYNPADKFVLGLVEEEKQALVSTIYGEASFNKGILQQAFHENLKRKFRPENDEYKFDKEELKPVEMDTVKGKVRYIEMLMKENMWFSMLVMFVLFIGLYLLTKHTGALKYLTTALGKRKK